jgi:steroid 5-alpha reductase family enzyme
VSPFTATLVVTVVAFVGLWWVSTRIDDVSIVDVYWGPGFAILATTALVTGAGTDPRRFLVVTLVAMWGFRLGGYLYSRKRGQGEDFRYAAMRRRAGDAFRRTSLVTVFLLQAFLMWVVSLPVQWVVTTPSSADLGFFDAVGVALWTLGLGFEAIGDLQLVQFKADPANVGLVLDTGLWRYTRHPNYFGDACVWWSFYAFALATPHGWWTILGPATMTGLLRRVSGVPMLERGLLKRRPDYVDYVARTSPFFPRPPRPASATRGDGRGRGAAPEHGERGEARGGDAIVTHHHEAP